MTRAHGILAALMAVMYALVLTIDYGTTRLLSVALLHILILNLFLGLLEASILRKGFSARRRTAIPRMIAANYISFGIGASIVVWALNNYMQVTVQNGWKQALLSCAMVFFVTWAVKFPFVARCQRRRSFWFVRSLRASLMIHAVSSVILFIWYLIPSEFTLYTDVAHRYAFPSGLSREAFCYYISPEDGNVYRRPLSGEQPAVVAAVGPYNSNCRLEAIKEQNPPCIALYAHSGKQREEMAPIPLEIRVCGDDMLLFPRDYSGSKQAEHIVDLRQPEERHLEITVGPPSNPGLEITRLITGLNTRKRYSSKREKTRLAFQTPFFRCHVKYVTVLPNDYVLFQIENEIYVFDPSSRSLRRVAAGQTPVVVLQR